MKPHKTLAILVLLGILLAACAQTTPTAELKPILPTEPAVKELILATTTSTQDSGLLDELIPIFEEKTGYIVQTVAVGSGQAMQMGVDCNADVLLVHSPAAEVEFMDAGNGVDRQLVMHNDFIVVGPATDPAGIKASTSALEAFQKIAETESPFISRGDDSGTHKMELGLWKKAEVTPEGAWYEESGQGMGATLTIASEKEAYTLTDRATYLANKASLDQEILVEGDPVLLNIYHVIRINPEKCTMVNEAGAQTFADFIVAEETQDIIGQFGAEEYGQPLFFADAGKDEGSLAP
jgi:tungstate transport system substrate-binding protein